MRKARLIAGILAISMVILMSSTLQAYAADYSIFWGYTVTPKGNVWQITTVSPVGTKLFSGKDVNQDSVEVEIWHTCQNNPVLHPHTRKPMKVVLTDKFITLVFDRKELPASAEYTKVFGTLKNNVDTFSAQGPGFVVCLIGC